MEQRTTYMILESIIMRALRNMRQDPLRKARNLIDLVAHFVHSEDHRNFLEQVKEAVSDPASPSAGMIIRLAQYTDAEYLCRFGMNLGYNGLFCASGIIRKQAEEGIYIPWIMHIPSDISAEETDRIMAAGESHGIRVWNIHCECDPLIYLKVLPKHAEDAVILTVPADCITDAFCDELTHLPHVMCAVSRPERDKTAFVRLRNRHLLYSLYISADDVLSGSCTDTETFGAAFLLLDTSGEPLSEETYRMIIKQRENGNFGSIPWIIPEDDREVSHRLFGHAELYKYTAEDILKDHLK